MHTVIYRRSEPPVVYEHAKEPSRWWELLHSDSHKFLMSAVPDEDRGRSPERRPRFTTSAQSQSGGVRSPHKGRRASSAPPAMRLSDLLVESSALKSSSLASTNKVPRWASKSLAEFICATQSSGPSLFPADPKQRRNSLKRQLPRPSSFSVQDPPYAVH